MCDNPSPARTNNPAVASPTRDIPHAGFGAARPQGAGSDSSSTGPSLSGWPRQVSWSEFRDIASRPSGESENARISVGLRPGQLVVEQEDGQHKLGNMTFRMQVNESTSWVVTAQKNSILLAHEQGHFDLVGLCYRDLLAELRRLRGSSRNRLVREVRSMMGRYDQQADELSRQYDSSQETNHGQNTERQQIWEAQIQTCIQSGIPFAAPD